MKDSNIITLYKNKGNHSDCNNYHGISLLSVIGKMFACIILHRLQILADRIYPESQCGFHSKRSTIDMIFSLCQLQEKCREQNQPLYLAFIDLTKAFDLVSRDGLFKMLPLIGCAPKLLSIVRSFHDGMMSTVQFDGNVSCRVWSQEWSQTRLRTCSNPLWYLLCSAFKTCLQEINRWCIPPF